MRISYDAYDLPVEVTSGNEVWTMEYTPMGNLRRQTRRTSSMRMVSALNYEYDSYDQLKFVENEHGERYFFERNLNGEVICERGFDGAERHYIRDLDGTVITTQLPDGTTVHHQHDLAGRLTYNKYTDGSWEAWEYDKAGRLTKAYNRDSVTEFVRNALGQVIKETQDGRTVEHKYDERSQLSNIVSALGGNITYGYDIKGSVNHISAGMSGQRKPWEANIAYDRFGRETSRMMPGCVENTMHYDSIGRPAHQRVRHNGQTLYDKSYTWGDNLRLLRTFDTINGRSVRYDYDTFGSLSGAVFGDGSRQWRNPDLMGNVYDSPDRTDRSYGRGGQLREDKKWRYYYDSHGNLVLKTMRRSGPSLETGMRDEFLAWQSGDYAYTWQGNGMLRSVTRPDGKTVTFRYDALGRRIEKVFDGRVYRYLWDGDVILHEWDYAEADRPNTVVTETGEVTLDRPEPVENLITWVYDSDSYVPTAKIVGDRHYSIISDYIGRPVQVYDDNGNIVWQADYDIYGNVRNLHGSRKFIPFRQLGQYEDEETGVYYNRFRYYDPNTGTYISQNPISILGGVNTFAYVFDCNIGIDIMGLTVTVAQVDTYGELLKNSTVGDDLEFHHIPQDKLGFLPRKEGIAVVMPKSEHAMTRTYKTKGRITASLDKNRAFKDILKDDLVDLRKISPKYDDAIIKIIKGYEDLDMIGKGELTLSKIIESCKQMRTEILKLKEIGRMPNESLDDNESIDSLIRDYDELLSSIKLPLSYEEGKVLVSLFPEEAFYDLQWDLLKLVESLYGKITNDKYHSLIQECPSKEWREALLARYNNTR